MKIAAIHYTKLPPQCNNIKQNLFDLTEFRMQGPLHDLSIHVSNNVTDTLNSLGDEFDWVVVVATGNYFHQQQLILDTVKHAVANNSPLICHIMHRGGYFYLHPQWFAINLKVWKSIGCPSFEESGASTFTTTKVERSVENFHDDYTPFWIKPGSEECSYTTEFGFYGTKAIRSFIEAGHTVINLPNSIRNQKFYSYPDSNHQLIEQIINDPETELSDQTPIHSFNDQIKLDWHQTVKGRKVHLVHHKDSTYLVCSIYHTSVRGMVARAKLNGFIGKNACEKGVEITSRDLKISFSSINL